MNYPQAPQNDSNLIQQAAFDYLNNSFSQNPAQPLTAGAPGQKGGTVQQPQAPPNNIGKVASLASMMGGGGGAGAAAGGF